REHWYQVSLRQACAMTLVACSAAAMSRYVHDRYRTDQNRLRELESLGWWTGYSNDNLAWYLQPLRDTMLLEEKDWLFFRIEWDRSDADDVPAIDQFLAREIWKQGRLPFVRDVLIADSSLTDEG